jgi:hypothetical protein
MVDVKEEEGSEGGEGMCRSWNTVPSFSECEDRGTLIPLLERASDVHRGEGGDSGDGTLVWWRVVEVVNKAARL